MICPKCKARMKCMDSTNDSEGMTTARRYKCLACGEKVYTIETVESKAHVNYLLAQKWQNGKR